jgi:uncharacterized protein
VIKGKIHKFQQGGLRILLDVPSGAVHIIDEITWDIMDHYDGTNAEAIPALLADTYTAEEVVAVLDELQELQNAGALFAEEAKPVEVFEAPAIVKSLCLHIAHDCNLRCGYCFAGSGNFGGDRTMMTSEVGKKAIDFVIDNSHGRRNSEIDFFGGEPLLNFAVVKEIVAYGKQQAALYNKEFKFTLTTNGVLLDDEIIAYLNENQISVVLSLDGRPEVHDRMRPNCGGGGSYASVQSHITKLVKSRDNQGYYVRGTFTKWNTDFDADVLHMADLGYKQLSVEPVVGTEDEPYAFSENDLPALYDAYERLAVEFLARKREGRDFNFFHFNLDINNGPCIAKRLSGCGAGHEYFAVTPTGELYPCHQFVGREEFKMGDVWQGMQNRELSMNFRRTHIFNKQDCPDCWARYYCSGGCHANAQAFNNDITKPYKLGCQLQKKRLECAIMIQAKLALDQNK